MTTNQWYASFIPGYMISSKRDVIKSLDALGRAEEQNIFMQLLNLTIDTYEWKDLPDSCNSRFFEMMLTLNGWGGITTTTGDYTTCGIMPKKWNIYGDSVTSTNFWYFGSTKEGTDYVKGSDNSNVDTCICRCNTVNYPLINIIRTYATRIADLRKSLDICCRQLKSPYFVRCEESQRETVDRMLNDIMNNKILVVGSNSKSLQPDAFEVLQTGINPANAETLNNMINEEYNRFFTYIGISNLTNQSKKERLVVSEAESSNEVTNDFLFLGLKTRQEFCDNFNDWTGMNISVEINQSREYNTRDELKNAFNGGNENNEQNI